MSDQVPALIAKKDFGKAVEVLKAVTQKEPHNRRLRLQLADVYVMAGRGREAISGSRRLPAPLSGHTVGVLVQANHGVRELLRIDGVPVGEAITDLRPDPEEAAAFNSILMLVATDLPLFDYQLDRLARRAVHGLARTGSISSNSSGDFTLAFSTANRIPRRQFWAGDSYRLRGIDQYDIAPLFEAAAEATEEAIVNALFMATDMAGRDGHRVFALPLARTLEIMARHGRLFAAGEAGREVSA